MSGARSSAEHRIGLVPCPLCRNIAAKKAGCRACEGVGMVGVDKAIEIGTTISDTEREMQAVSPPSSAPAPAVPPSTERDPEKKGEQ